MRFILFLLVLFGGTNVYAQTFTVVADSLRLPNGLEVDAQGRLWVVESGYGFNDGAVSILQPDGTLLPVIVGLPSVFDTMTQENVGPWHTLALPGNKLAVSVAAAGQVAFFDLNGFVPGQSAPMTLANAFGALNIYGYATGNGFLESDPYTMTYDLQGNLYIADAAANAIFKSTPLGQLSVFASFPPTPNPIPVGPPFVDAVPTRILAKPGGGFYVCQLTGFPFLDGGASVFTLDASGNATPFATGLTTLTDMALDPASGDLYVMQIGHFDLNIFNFAPNTAKITRIRPDGSQQVVAENFDLAPGMTLDGQGNIYVSQLGLGRVLKFDGIATGVQDKESNLTDFSLSPNPASSVATIRFSLKNTSSLSVHILDAAGKQVYAQNLGKQEAGEHSMVWNRGAQPAGIYWVDIQTDKGIKTQRLILQ